MNLEPYEALDLSPHSPLAQDLAGRLDEEMRLGILVLTPPHAASAQRPAMLTPGMLAWYQANVGPARFAALQRVKALFDGVDLGNGQRGFLLEELMQERERDVLVAQREERRQFLMRDRNAGLLRKLREASHDYAETRSARGREARRWNPWRYWSVLLLLGPLEALLNFESFLQIPGFTPAFATALTAIVWLLVAGAGHIVGESWKQAPERFGEQTSRAERRANARYLALGLASFAVALGAVSWGRWFYLRETFARMESLGDAVGVGDYVLFAGSLLGNIALFILGVIWSWWAHDEVPRYAEARAEMERLERRLQRAYDRVVARRAIGLNKQLAAALKALEQRNLDQRGASPAFDRNRAAFDALCGRDAAVLALLQHYRNALCRRVVEAGHAMRFRYSDVGRGGLSEASTELDAAHYMAIGLTLPFTRPPNTEAV